MSIGLVVDVFICRHEKRLGQVIRKRRFTFQDLRRPYRVSKINAFEKFYSCLKDISAWLASLLHLCCRMRLFSNAIYDGETLSREV